MCQWCVENDKCECQVNCEIAITTGHIAGDTIITCPNCKHIVKR